MPSSDLNLIPHSFPPRRSSDLNHAGRTQHVLQTAALPEILDDADHAEARRRRLAGRHYLPGDADVHDLAERRFRRFETEVADGIRSEEHTSELQSPCNIVCPLPISTSSPTLSLHDALPI